MPKPEHRYEPPVDQLLKLGESWVPTDEWPDYPDMGLGPQDVPELLRLAGDRQVYSSKSQVRVWGPVHTWRALAQLGAADAVEPLIALLRDNGDDAAGENIPRALAVLGAPAVQPLIRELHDGDAPDDLRFGMAKALGDLAARHPEQRAACVEAIVAQMERFEQNSRELNAFLLVPLLDLMETAAADTIERAFAAGAVDESMAGDWEDVQVTLGLRTERTTPRPNYVFESLRRMTEKRRASEEENQERRTTRDEEWDEDLADDPVEPRPGQAPSPRKAARAKQRKKLEKQSRRKNRRR